MMTPDLRVIEANHPFNLSISAVARLARLYFVEFCRQTYEVPVPARTHKMGSGMQEENLPFECCWTALLN